MSSDETREFTTAAPDMEAAQRVLDEQMTDAGYVRISGGHEVDDRPGHFGAWGWRDLDGDGEIG